MVQEKRIPIATAKLLAGLALAVAAAALVACNETTSTSQSASAFGASNALTTTPAGFNQLTSSFNADSDANPFQPQFGPGPGGQSGRGPGGPGGPGGPAGPGVPGGFGFGLGGLDLMGGGLGGPFFGDGLEAGFGHGPFDGGRVQGNCAFSSATGIVTCDTVVSHGLSVVRTAQYLTATGQAQSAVDSTTNTIKTTTVVSGTVTLRDSSTSTVNESSQQTIGGLASGSTKRTVDGTSSGSEATTGTSAPGQFNALRTVGDTVSGVVIPVDSTGRPTYPTAGTVIRAMQFSATVAGSTTTSSRREVVTYNGSNTATVVITQDGTTKTCTLPLPHGRLACP